MATDRPRILLVEDNPLDARLFRENLSEVVDARYDLIGAATLGEALATAAQTPCDLAVIDLSLPDCQGLAALALLRERQPRLPIMILTGHHAHGMALEALRHGAQEYVVKGKADGDTLWRAIRYAIERKRAELAVQDLTAELEQRVAARTLELSLANEQLEAFLYTASHDIRTPLRTIAGFASLLQDEVTPAPGSEAANLLERIDAAVARIDERLQALVGLSGIGRSPVSRAEVDLAEMGRRVAGALREVEPERPVEVVIPARLPALADPGMTEIALHHLLANGWKFTRQQARPCIELGAEEARGETIYYVRDNGIGFDMAYADKLFRPFQSLHRGLDLGRSGAGIGLATVQRVAHLHGGRAWAAGAPGEGATFRFTLSQPLEG